MPLEPLIPTIKETALHLTCSVIETAGPGGTLIGYMAIPVKLGEPVFTGIFYYDRILFFVAEFYGI